MLKKWIAGDLRRARLMNVATVFFMAASAALMALTACLLADLVDSVGNLMDSAIVPDVVQMHMGGIDEKDIEAFAASRPEVRDMQVQRFLNLANGEMSLGGRSLADSTQDNGLVSQNGRFDFLLDESGRLPTLAPGEVWVPMAYRSLYGLQQGDTMRIGDEELVISGFLRDAQMNSMMSSSKRFLVHPDEYERLSSHGTEEQIIEFLMVDGVDAGAFQSAYAEAGLPSNGPSITKPLIRLIGALSDGATVFVIFLVAALVLVVSLLCVRYIVSLQMERDRTDMGMLKAMGIGRREIRRLYLAKYLLLGAAGIAIGVPCAVLLQMPLSRQLHELYGPGEPASATWLWGLAAATATVGILLFSVAAAVHKAQKVPAVEGMQPQCPAGRAGGRTLLVGAVALVCAFLVAVPTNLYTTLSSPRFVTNMGIGQAQIRMDVRQGDDISVRTAGISEQLAADPDVARYAVLRTSSLPASVRGAAPAALNVEQGDHEAFPVSYSAGGPPLEDGDIAVSSLNAEELGLSIGDSIVLHSTEGDVQMRVCGVYTDITNGGKTAKTVVLPEGEPVTWSTIYVTLRPGADESAWMERYGQMGADVVDIEAYVRATYAQTLSQIDLASKAALWTAATVLFVVLALFMRLLVERERRDISLRKALGFTSGDILHQYVLRGLGAALVGVGAGLALSGVGAEAMSGLLLQSLGGGSLTMSINWGLLLVAASMACLVPALAAAWMGTREIRHVRACECCMGRE